MAPGTVRARHGAPRSFAAVVLAGLLVTSLVSCSGGDGGDGDDDRSGSTTASTTVETTVGSDAAPSSLTTGLRDVEVGQCFDTIDDPVATDRAVQVIDCTERHTYEVYDVLTYDGAGAGRGTPYPGEAAVQNWAEQACFDRFEAFVGVRWTVSELDIRAWWPSAESWGRADRTVICAVMSDTGEKLTGSQRGVNR